MSEYWSLFSQYFNMLTIVGGGIKIGLLSFVIVLVLLFCFTKRVLAKRCHRFLKYLAYSYYFWVPVLCLVWGFLYGIITTSRDQVIEKLPLYQLSIQSMIDHNFDVNIEIKDYAHKNLDEVLDGVVTEVQLEIASRLTKMDNNNRLHFVVMALNSPIGTNYIKSSLKDKISATTGLNRQLTDEIFEIKLSKIFTSDVIIKIFSFYIKQMVNSFLIPIMLIGILLLLMPLIEIILAYCYNRKHPIVVVQSRTKIV